MFYYISEPDKKYTSKEQEEKLKKIKEILNLKDIKWSYNEEFFSVICKKLNQNYLLYYEQFNKPLYLISGNEKDSIDIMKIYENINNRIDEYESVEYVILDIIQKTNIFLGTKKEEKKMDLNEFEIKLDEYKEKYILESESESKSKSNMEVFSVRSNIEMLHDQIVKLHKDEKFNVILNDFSNIIIKISNFTFIGSKELEILIDMKMNCLNLLSEPPKIKLSSNKILKDNILKVVSELKPFSDNKSWSIKYSIYESVQNIYNMINTLGEIEQEFSSEFDQLINELEYLVSIKNNNMSEIKLLELFDKDLVSSNSNTNPNTNSDSNLKNSAYWKKGTGYGNNKTKKWDIDKYIKNINEKKNKISSNYNKFIEYISIHYGDNNKLFLVDETINRIINLLINYFENEDIIKSNVILILNLIENNFVKFKSDKIIKFANLLKLLEEYKEDNDITHTLFDSKSDETNNIIKKISTNNKSDKFSELFDNQNFKIFNDEFNKFHYKTSFNINSNILTRLKKEFNILKKSITINQEASMFFWIEKNKLEHMRFIITGPKDTPYDQGLYIFDMTLNNSFPSKPPVVHFSNNGGARFNPNLYNCGKVCLSLLGTWSGDKGESWNSSTSTFFQILVSIQSQILIEEPYFNEPGYEREIGKEIGKVHSKEYNDKIRQYNLDYAINDLIEGITTSKSSYPEFEHIIRNYFKFKRDRIIGILEKWESEYDNFSKRKKFSDSVSKFKELSSKL